MGTTLRSLALLVFVSLCILAFPGSVSAGLDSQFVSQNVPTVMATDEIQEISVTFKNTGYYYWEPQNCILYGYSPPFDYTWSASGAYFGYSGLIAPGQQATFTFDITAPASRGTHEFEWRLYHPAYGWFGESSPRTSVDVLLPNDSICVSVDIPPDLRPGESAAVTCRFRNTGMSTWRASNNFSLRSLNQNWGVSQALFSSFEEIKLGEEKTFDILITAPLLEGLYDFKWRMHQAGTGWFGQYPPPTSLLVQKNKSAFVSQTVPTMMEIGETTSVSVTFKNTGGRTWSDSRGHALGVPNGSAWGINEIAMSPLEKIRTGEQKTFTFNIVAPMTPGTYGLQCQMVEDGTDWFGAQSPSALITVKGAPRITSLSPAKIPPSATTTIELAGSNLFAEDVYIPTRPGLAAPQITAIQELEFGTRLAVTVQASHLEYPWMLACTNFAGTDARDFRVAGQGPVVDAFCPSAPIIGGTTYLAVVGTNLEGATVTSTDPSVVISDLDNSNDGALLGMITVQGGAGPGFAQLLITKDGMTRPMDMNIVETATAQHREVTPGFGVFAQDMTVVGHDATPVQRAPFPGICGFLYQVPVFRNNFALGVTLRDLLGDSDPTILSGLARREVRDFGLRILAVRLEVIFTVVVDTCSGLQITTCIDAVGGIEVIGLGGFVGEFGFCFPGTVTGPQFQTTPQTPEMFLGVQSECFEPSPVPILGEGPEIAGDGIWLASLEVRECCPEPEPLLLDLNVGVFGGTPIAAQLDANDVEAARISTSATCTMCPSTVVALFTGFSASGGGIEEFGVSCLSQRIRASIPASPEFPLTTRVFRETEVTTAQLWALNEVSPVACFVIVAHSLGAPAAVALAQLLVSPEFNRSVRGVYLLDPVVGNPFDGNSGTLTVPSEVADAVSIHQISTATGEPQGLFVVDGAQNINAEECWGTTTLNCCPPFGPAGEFTHTNIDESCEVQDFIIDKVRDTRQ